MNDQTPFGHNNPPDPIDEVISVYADTIAESENWLDGNPVENEEQMNAVDALISAMRQATSDLGKAKKSATAPLHDAWKSEIARWKPTDEDFDRIKKGLAALVDPFKRKLAAEKEEARRAAEREAQRKADEARRAAESANAADIEAQREAAAKIQEAEDARNAAQVAKKDTVKGLRKVTRYETTDHRAALRWIAQNDRDAVTEFINEYVRRNHKTKVIDGVRVWDEREAF